MIVCTMLSPRSIRLLRCLRLPPVEIILTWPNKATLRRETFTCTLVLQKILPTGEWPALELCLPFHYRTYRFGRRLAPAG